MFIYLFFYCYSFIKNAYKYFVYLYFVIIPLLYTSNTYINGLIKSSFNFNVYFKNILKSNTDILPVYFLSIPLNIIYLFIINTYVDLINDNVAKFIA